MHALTPAEMIRNAAGMDEAFLDCLRAQRPMSYRIRHGKHKGGWAYFHWTDGPMKSRPQIRAPFSPTIGTDAIEGYDHHQR